MNQTNLTYRPFFKLILLGMVCCFSLNALAQKGSMKATVSKDLVAIGERFEFSLQVNNISGNITPPILDNFKIVRGPMQERGSSNFNGTVTRYSKFTYTLQATTVGKLKIGSATVQTNNGLIKSNVVSIKVVGSQEEVIKSGKKANIRKGEDENLFIRIYVSDAKVYKGEQLTVTYVLYNRYDGARVGSYELPQLSGFWKEDVKIGDIRYGDKLEKVNGLDYRKAVLARQVLIARQTGKLSLGPLKIDATLRQSFFNVEQKALVSNTPIVEVVPVPNAPKGYSGGVGKFNFEVIADNHNVNTNDAINLKVKVSGTGNLELLSAPAIDFDPDFEVYDPKIQDKISTSGGGMKGSRSFEYLIIPRFAGDYVIDPISFVFFDADTKKYVTKKSKRISIKVDGDPNDAAGKAQRLKKDVAILETDVRYIKSDTELRAKNDFFGGTGSHLALFSLPMLLLGGLWFWKKKNDDAFNDVTGTKIRKAGKKALKEINEARTALQANNKDAFYESVFDAIYNYLSEKLNIPFSELTKDNIQSSLVSRNVDESNIQALNTVLHSCEMARFAPRSKTDDEKMLQTADEVIHHLEKVL